MTNKFSTLILSATLVLATGPAFTRNLQIHTIDVGQGASELVIGPNGTTILIDGGTYGEGYSEVVPYLNGTLSSRHINYLIASHDDRDHYGGLNAVIAGGYSYNYIYHCGDNTDFGKGVQIPLGLVIDLGNGAKATCVGRYGEFVGGTGYPTGGNDGSICLLIEYGVFDYVTAGDLESNEWDLSNALMGSPYLNPAYGVDVIHVNHHGSDGSSQYYYINRLKPELAVINGGTCSDHPRWTTVDRIKGRAYYTIPCSCDPYRCGDPTYVTWSGAAAFRTTTGDLGDCRKAPLDDCPALGDMVITYDGVSPSYDLNGTPYAIDEPVPITPTPPPSPPPSPTPTLIPGEVIINEILAMVPLGIEGDSNGDGVRSYWQDEFIELVNWTNHTVNLGGCTISDSSYTRFTFADPLPIPSGKALVLFGGGTPTGWFGGAIILVASTQSYYGLGLTDIGDTVTLRKGDEIYDRVTYGQQTYSSYNRWPDIRGSFTTHNLIPAAEGRLFSPGTKVDGAVFPPPAPSPTPFATPDYLVLEDGDYDGDGTDDIAIFKTASGLWAVKEITRVYFGSSSDLPIPADYNGDGTTDIAVFKAASGLWAIRGLTRLYFGLPCVGVRPLSPPAYPSRLRLGYGAQAGSDPYAGDLPVPADYDGDGRAEIAIFRERSGLWAVRGVTRLYFGSFGDVPVPGDYNGDGRADIGIFRGRNGLWAVKLPAWTPRVYFGAPGDRPVAGDYAGNGFWTAAVFRGSSGLWAIRNLTRWYFGGGSDRPVPADYDADGADDIGIFRAGLWAVRGVTRTYFGSTGDFPVTR